MARRPNSIQTAELKLSTTPAVVQYLEQLVATGLYGKSKAEAAERLLTRSLEALVKEGALTKLSKG